ncbi:MAG: hypothetical protein HY700_22030 [Gemmatimonadetes bacterium]|nr:hypothetical protein [Gemmatimonadota bacterium]
MSEGVRVFVNERAVIVIPGATIREAVLAFDPELASALREGRAYVTDGVGRAVEPSGSVEPGAIFRVVVSARGQQAGG